MSSKPLDALTNSEPLVALYWEHIYLHFVTTNIEGIMETYVFLGNYTQKGVAKSRKAPQGLRQLVKRLMQRAENF
jgi:hypothetical protein